MITISVASFTTVMFCPQDIPSIRRLANDCHTAAIYLAGRIWGIVRESFSSYSRNQTPKILQLPSHLSFLNSLRRYVSIPDANYLPRSHRVIQSLKEPLAINDIIWLVYLSCYKDCHTDTKSAIRLLGMPNLSNQSMQQFASLFPPMQAASS